MSTTTGPDKKPVRRVRVIEILDDEELDGTADEKAAEPGVPGEAKDEAGAGVTLLKADTDTDTEAEAEADTEPAPVKKPVVKTPSGRGKLPAVPSGAGGRTPLLLTVAVVVLALLAGFALFQWRSAAGAAEERKELVSRVTAFGDLMATYSYDDVESANKKAMTYLVGDALEERKKVDLTALREQLESQKTRLKSTTYAVYVGSVDGNLASAVLVFDLRGESTALAEPQTIAKSHLTLGLIKRDGEWMISSMVPAGSESASSASTPTGAVPNGTPSASPDKADKPENKDEKN
ncbi:hypothetical protein [Actinocorallia aurantiaca]|uniref:Mce-associated membrane protein n=1 Tax=Actinocorallia aurantiaca TaxID=46204 RepID=A0ABN3U6J6_9ACTN